MANFQSNLFLKCFCPSCLGVIVSLQPPRRVLDRELNVIPTYLLAHRAPEGTISFVKHFETDRVEHCLKTSIVPPVLQTLFSFQTIFFFVFKFQIYQRFSYRLQKQMTKVLQKVTQFCFAFGDGFKEESLPEA